MNYLKSILIIGILIIFSVKNMQAQVSTTTGVDEVKTFIASFIDGCQYPYSRECSQSYTFPFTTIWGFDYEASFELWDSIPITVKDELGLLGTFITKEFKVDEVTQMPGFTIKLEYISDQNAYRFVADFDDEDMTTEEFWFKKINGAFKFYKVEFYSFFDLF